MNLEKTILIIDDTDTNLHMLLELLEDKYDVLATLDGFEALEIVQEEEKIDLILLDIMMPNIDGFEVCKRLKEDEKTNKIPIVFITAKTDIKSINKIYEVGGIDHICKPFNVFEILEKITKHII